MTKVAVFLSALLAAGFVTGMTLDLSPDSTQAWQEEGISQQEIDAHWINYKCFKETLEASVDSLRRGEITLSEAHARVSAASRRYHPVFLEVMKYAEDGATDDVRLARNLVSHVQSLESANPTSPSRMAALEAELQEFLAAAKDRSACPAPMP